MNDEQKKMTPLPSGEVIPGIWAINNGFVNFYLIKSHNGYVAIDCGADNEQSKAELAKLAITGEQVKAVLLTHDHGDHLAALPLFGAAPIYAVNNKLATTVIADGDSFETDGLKVKVIAATGHKEDSVAFLINDSYLFVGDNMSLKDGKPQLFNSVYNQSDVKQQDDIKKLTDIAGVSYIFTAHYGFIKK
ncbi:MAG: MBL fold metallo-hydrolase [Spirochaetaceae bacterium]|nr:MBL fold metallo-hydrolase [Spirochaetaceae bacterium]